MLFLIEILLLIEAVVLSTTKKTSARYGCLFHVLKRLNYFQNTDNKFETVFLNVVAVSATLIAFFTVFGFW